MIFAFFAVFVDFFARCIAIIFTMWQVYASLSALFAALTAVFAKIGVSGINSNLATAIRTAVILVLTWAIALSTTGIAQIKSILRHSLLFLILSGLATGASWLFYFKAIQLGDVSRVAPVDKLSVVFAIILSFLILGEPVSAKVIVGGALIAAGSLVLIWQ